MKSIKKYVLWVFMAAVGALLADAPAHAQGNRVAVNIPFDFQAGTVVYKAGSYRIERSSGSLFLTLTSADGRTHYAFLSPADNIEKGNGEPYLVFTRYGEEAFLNKIVFSSGVDYDVPRSSREKEVLSKVMPSSQTAVLIYPGQM